MGRIIFNERNEDDGLIITIILIIPAWILCWLLFSTTGIIYLIPLFLSLILVPLFVTRYSIIFSKNKVIVLKKIFGITYSKATSDFTSINFSDEEINFVTTSSKVSLINWIGDGYLWGDYPDSIVASFGDKNLVLGTNEKFDGLKEKIKRHLTKV